MTPLGTSGSAPLLSLEDLSVGFAPRGVFRARTVDAVVSVSLGIAPGEVLAVVGASGSGKSVVAEAILGILPPTAAVAGSIQYDGAPLDAAALARVRGREIAYIPQSVGHLDPLMTVGRQVRIGLPAAQAHAVQSALFARYGLGDHVARQYPFELSGGMLRRALFATAIRDTVRLVVADEPTPGLHAEAVAEVMGHLRELAQRGVAVLLITHDIAAATAVADRVAIMRSGRLLALEQAAAFSGGGEGLTHPFARDLWLALPQNRFSPGGA